MFESFRNGVDVRAVAIFAGFLLVVCVPGLWYVKKTTGRSWRDMLAVLGAGVTLILLLGVGNVFFHDRLNSPDSHARRLAENIFVAVFAVAAVIISWVFNRLAKSRSNRRKPERADKQLT